MDEPDKNQLGEKTFSDLVINSLPGIFYIFNEEGKFLRWNNNLEIITGYSSSEIAEMKSTDLFVEEEKATVANCMKKVFVTGKSSVEARLISKNGRATSFLFSGQRIEIGNKTYLAGMGIDITSLKMAEDAVRTSTQELSSINRVISTCSTSLNLNTILQKALDEALEITGLEGGTFCLLEPDDTLSLGAHRNASEAMIHDLTSHNIRVGDCLCGTCAYDKRPIILWNRDEVLFYSTREAAIRDDIRFHASFPVVRENICLGVLCVFTRTDRKPSARSLNLLKTITDQIAISIENAKLYNNILDYSTSLEEKVAERTAELEEANARLKELDRLKSIFIASMSHELRTPLNSIIGFTDIILQGISGDITEVQRKQISIVQKSSKHLLALINDVTDISMIEAEKVDIVKIYFDFSLLVYDIRDSFMQEAEEKGLKLLFSVPEDLIICSDERRIRQILINLMSNAIKFTPHGVIETTVSETEGMVRVSVLDTGIGIKKEDMPKLFTAFGKIPHEHMPIIEGTGVGLYLSFKIAKLLGGELHADSEFGKGSTFTFLFPGGT